jgi:Tol biopolymer transport system component
LSPVTPGDFTIQGDRLIFTPDQALSPGEQYTAVLAAGATGLDGRQVKADFEWSFTVRLPSIIFRGNEDNNIYRTPIDDGESQRLTQSGQIFDYTPSWDGNRIAYSVINEEKGVDLWIMARNGEDKTILVNCGLDRCSAPAWSPDGARLAYSRSEAGLGPGEPLSPTRIWLVDISTGETARLFQNPQKIGFGPSWSPDGGKLAYSDGVNNRIVILDLQSGAEFYIPTQTSQVGSWSPDGSQMVYGDILFLEGETREVVNRIDLVTEDIINLFGHRTNDGSFNNPVWSPTGEWIASKVRLSGGNIQDELWLMAPDGTHGIVIEKDPAYVYLNYNFDPTGRYLVYQRIPLDGASADQDVLLFDLQKHESTALVSKATFPAWLP